MKPLGLKVKLELIIGLFFFFETGTFRLLGLSVFGQEEILLRLLSRLFLSASLTLDKGPKTKILV